MSNDAELQRANAKLKAWAQALNSFAMKGDDRKAMDAGCDGYITKPIDTVKLPELVAEILQRPVEPKPKSS
jgi:CheY-like chemotaxis protein